MNTIISARQLDALGDSPDLVILDARWDLMRPQWALEAFSAAHIPGAQFVSLDDDLSGKVGPETGRHPLPEPDALIANLRRLGVNSRSTVAIYDHAGGAFAARAWWLLQWLGHRQAFVLDGGIAAWTSEGYPLQAETQEPLTGDFAGEANSAWLVEADSILDSLARGVPVVDARDAERFAGRVEPIDAVAGHIPGARNAPFGNFQDAESRFLPAPDLRHRWSDIVGIQPEHEWIVMCGSGVTACNLALSSQIAGLSMPRLYAGSWSEWIRDPSRPVARS